MADIFISYASEDRDRAASLARSLEGCGFSVWWDRELRAGSDFTQAIGEQLDGARCVVVLWSNSSIGSNWVRDEAAEGLKRRVLVPVAVDAVQPPYGFRSLQTADLSGWSGDGSAPAFQRLVADLHLLLVAPSVAAAASASAEPVPAPNSAAAAMPDASAARPRRYAAPAAAAALLTAAVIAVFVFRQPGGAPPAAGDHGSAAAGAASAASAASAAEAASVAAAASTAEAARVANAASAAAAEAAKAARAASVAEAERAAADQRRRDEQRRAEAARRAEAQRVADESQAAAARELAIDLDSDQLDFGTSAFGSSVKPRRVLINNGSGAPVEFTITARGPDDRAFMVRDTSCPKSAHGWRLDDACWIAWSFVPPRPGKFSNRIGFEVDGHPVARGLLLAGIAVERDTTTAANTIRIDYSRCRRTDAKTFTIDVNGQVEAEVAAFVVVTARIADDRTTLGCRGWGAAAPENDAKLQGACKRRARDPRRTTWKAQIVLRSPRPPPEAYAQVLAIGADGRMRVLARDSAALDCG